MNKKFIKSLFLVTMLVSSVRTMNAGPVYPVCVFECELACTGIGVIPVALPIYLACAALCPAACLVSCFDGNTNCFVVEKDKTIEKSVSLIKVGDVVLTLKDGKLASTKVVKNVALKGEFESIQIDVQNNSGETKQLHVTPEHGVIVLGQDDSKVIEAAKNIFVGDRVITANGEIFSVINVAKSVMYEKYTLETSDGTVLASGVLVTTLCDEEIENSTQDFDSKMSDWRARHDFASSAK